MGCVCGCIRHNWQGAGSKGLPCAGGDEELPHVEQPALQQTHCRAQLSPVSHACGTSEPEDFTQPLRKDINERAVSTNNPRKKKRNKKARVGGVRSQQKKGAGWSRRGELRPEWSSRPSGAERYGFQGAATAAGPRMCCPRLPLPLRGTGREWRLGTGKARGILPKLVCVCFDTKISN